MDQLREILRQYWGYDDFRPLQAEAMQAVVEGRDSVVVLPTGGGKIAVLPGAGAGDAGLAVVVSPLISLMKDQVDALVDCGVPAACVNSTLSPNEKRRIADEIRAERLKLLYLSPERLLTERTLEFLQRRAAVVHRHRRGPLHQRLGPRLPARVPRAAAAEGHVSQRRRARLHGHRHAARARRHRPRAAACTSRRCSSARSTGRTWSIACGGAANLLQQVREVIDRHPDESGIIYCIRRADVEDIAASLCDAGLPAPCPTTPACRRRPPAQPGRFHQRPGPDHRGHGRLRHGHRQVGRAVRDPRRRAEVAGKLSAGERPRRPRRPGGRVLAVLFGRRFSDCGASCSSELPPHGVRDRDERCWPGSTAIARASPAGIGRSSSTSASSCDAENCGACDVCLAKSTWSTIRSSSRRRFSPASCGSARTSAATTWPRCWSARKEQRILSAATTGSAPRASWPSTTSERPRLDRAARQPGVSGQDRRVQRAATDRRRLASAPRRSDAAAAAAARRRKRSSNRGPNASRGKASTAACSKRCASGAAAKPTSAACRRSSSSATPRSATWPGRRPPRKHCWPSTASAQKKVPNTAPTCSAKSPSFGSKLLPILLSRGYNHGRSALAFRHPPLLLKVRT